MPDWIRIKHMVVFPFKNEPMDNADYSVTIYLLLNNALSQNLSLSLITSLRSKFICFPIVQEMRISSKI